MINISINIAFLSFLSFSSILFLLTFSKKSFETLFLSYYSYILSFFKPSSSITIIDTNNSTFSSPQPNSIATISRLEKTPLTSVSTLTPGSNYPFSPCATTTQSTLWSPVTTPIRLSFDLYETSSGDSNLSNDDEYNKEYERNYNSKIQKKLRSPSNNLKESSLTVLKLYKNSPNQLIGRKVYYIPFGIGKISTHISIYYFIISCSFSFSYFFISICLFISFSLCLSF